MANKALKLMANPVSDVPDFPPFSHGNSCGVAALAITQLELSANHHYSMTTMPQSVILEQNLSLVFNERDPQKRLAALANLYTDDAVMYEPENIVTGQADISSTVDSLLGSLPPGFRFFPVGAAVGHHDLFCLRWTGSIPDGTVIVSGTDVAHLRDGRIASLYVLIDPPTQ